MTAPINRLSVTAFSIGNVTVGQRTVSKILSFRKLKRGWHYGQGSAISHGIIEKALRIHSVMLSLGFFETNAFPGVDGEVLLTCYFRDHCIEVTIEANSDYSSNYSPRYAG